MDQCNHIIGYFEYHYEGWSPVYTTEEFCGRDSDGKFPATADNTIRFNYCPLCGDTLLSKGAIP